MANSVPSVKVAWTVCDPGSGNACVSDEVPSGPTVVVSPAALSIVQAMVPEPGFGVTVAVNLAGTPIPTGSGERASDVSVAVRLEATTRCWNGSLVTGGWAPSPPYSATRDLTPATSRTAIRVATPASTVALPRSIDPPPVTSRKLTVPVAVAGTTTAVKVTAAPTGAGFCDEPSVTVTRVSVGSATRPAPKDVSIPGCPRSTTLAFR